MIEYRKLALDGHCSLCGDKIKRNGEEVRVVTFYYRSGRPTVNICEKCAHRIYFAPQITSMEITIGD